jgi:hypothetical protein
LKPAGPVRVQVVAEPPLLREVLRAHVEANERLIVVEDVSDADVLVTSSSRGPLHVSRLVDTALVGHPSQLVATILARLPQAHERLVVVLPDVVEQATVPPQPTPTPAESPLEQ